jgi:hypothetical protein
LRQQWCIPPGANADFVSHLEEVLEVDTRASEARVPQICLDETCCQLHRDRYLSEPMQPGQPQRDDYHYEPQGVCNLFLACEPLAGRRYVWVTEHHRAVDWATVVRELLEGYYPQAEKIVLVLDHLKTQTPASFYKVFEPALARRLTEKLEIPSTPKHGSWVNRAEIELGVVARQALAHRVESREALTQQVAAWQARRNAANSPIDWRFTTPHARTKLKRLYPSLQE